MFSTQSRRRRCHGWYTWIFTCIGGDGARERYNYIRGAIIHYALVIPSCNHAWSCCELSTANSFLNLVDAHMASAYIDISGSIIKGLRPRSVQYNAVASSTNSRRNSLERSSEWFSLPRFFDAIVPSSSRTAHIGRNFTSSLPRHGRSRRPMRVDEATFR